MQRAINETQSRRKMQENFNKKNKFKPKGIYKPVKDILDLSKKSAKKKFIENVEEKLEEDYLSPKELSTKIDQMESLMLTHANKLEFEEAASIRDKISKLKEKLFQA